MNKEVLQKEIFDAKTRFDQLNNDNIYSIGVEEIKFHLEIRNHKVGSDNFNAACEEHKLPNNNSEETIRQILIRLIEQGDLVGYARQFKINDSMFKDPIWVCICLMHLIMRVSEKLITKLLQEGIKSVDSTRGKRIKNDIGMLINRRLSNLLPMGRGSRAEETSTTDTETGEILTEETAQQYLEAMAERATAEDLGEDIKYDFQIKTENATGNKSKISDFKISYVRVNKVLDIIDDIIDVCEFDLESKKDEYKKVFKLWFNLKSNLLKEDDFSEEDIDKLDDEIYEFRERLFELFGGGIVTNYFHIVISTHLIDMIKKFGSIAKLSGIGFENLVGRVRSYVLKRTNNGGNAGRNEKKKKIKAVVNVSKFMLRSFARKIDNLDKKSPIGDLNLLSKLYLKGNLVNKALR